MITLINMPFLYHCNNPGITHHDKNSSVMTRNLQHGTGVEQTPSQFSIQQIGTDGSVCLELQVIPVSVLSYYYTLKACSL